VFWCQVLGLEAQVLGLEGQVLGLEAQVLVNNTDKKSDLNLTTGQFLFFYQGVHVWTID